MTSPARWTTSDRWEFGLLLLIASVLFFGSVFATPDIGVRLGLAGCGILFVIAALHLWWQRRSGRSRPEPVRTWDRKEWLAWVLIAAGPAMLLWAYGPRNWLTFVVTIGWFSGGRLVSNAVARRWPKAGLRSWLRHRRDP